jgi:parvulin-like peptidyl-prolyl isomerase
VKPGATGQEEENVRKKALELRARAERSKADFAEIARKNSQDPATAEKGGDVGWLREPDLLPPVREALAGLPDNGVTQPVRAQDGWHILKLLETKAAMPVPLQDAKPQIVQLLRQARVQRLVRARLEEMLKTQPVAVNEIELAKQVGAGK